MKILIAGGAGMVGSHCAERFAKDHEVVVLDNLMRSQLFGANKKSVEYNWEYLKTVPNVALFRGDIRSQLDIIRAIDGNVDVVINCAGQPGVQYSIDHPLVDFEINTKGTLNLLEVARMTNPKTTFLFCSTNKVYGDGKTPYGVSKLAADIYVQEYAHTYGLKTGAFRMSCIYGTRQFGFEDQGWVAWFVINTLLDRGLTIYGDGSQVRDLLFVDDLVDAFDTFIKSPVSHGLYDIGGGEDNKHSLLTFMKLLYQSTGKMAKISFSDWRLLDQRYYVSDLTKIKNELRWEPKTNVKEGVDKLIRWVRDNETIL